MVVGKNFPGFHERVSQYNKNSLNKAGEYGASTNITE